MESTATNRVWHDGPPPHVGWWNASTMHFDSLWSWWDGEKWSPCVMDNMDETYAGTVAMQENEHQEVTVFWNDYWPENARVPRIKEHVDS